MFYVDNKKKTQQISNDGQNEMIKREHRFRVSISHDSRLGFIFSKATKRYNTIKHVFCVARLIFKEKIRQFTA